MRSVIIAGIALFCMGAFVLLRGASFTSRRDVLTVAGLEITASQRQSIPPWVGGLAMVGGAAIVLLGSRWRGLNPATARVPTARRAKAD